MWVKGVDTGTSLRHRDFRIHRMGRAPKCRVWCQITGTAPPTSLGVYNASARNAERAFLERYYYCEVAPGVFAPALPVANDAYFADPWLLAFLVSVVRHVVLPPPAPIFDVVEAYRGTKHRRYIEAAKRLELLGLMEAHCTLKAFVKFEKQDLSKAPRVINPRAPEYNLELGRFLKFAEKEYFLAIQRTFGHPVVIKGYDHFEGARIFASHWHEFAEPVAVGLDAKKFDMHVSPAALTYEHAFYVCAYARCTPQQACAKLLSPTKGDSGTVQRLCYLLMKQVCNRGKARFPDGRIKFSMRGTRSSGDLNTSLGNCLIMCSLVHSYASRQRVKIRLANNGDDCVVFLERSCLARFVAGIPQFFNTFGFRMTVEPPVSILERAEFCQSHALYDGRAWRFVRHPRVVIQKAAMCLIPIKTRRDIRKWMMAVGLCEGFIYDGVPVLSSWARAYRRSGVYASLKFQAFVFKNTSRGYAVGNTPQQLPVLDAARVSFFKAFGITPEEQIALEQLYDNWRFCWDVIRVESFFATCKPLFDWDAAFVLLAGRKF